MHIAHAHSLCTHRNRDGVFIHWYSEHHANVPDHVIFRKPEKKEDFFTSAQWKQCEWDGPTIKVTSMNFISFSIVVCEPLLLFLLLWACYAIYKASFPVGISFPNIHISVVLYDKPNWLPFSHCCCCYCRSSFLRVLAHFHKRPFHKLTFKY